MNISKKFIVGILIAFVLLFALQLQMPKSFSWDITFSHTDKNPFGSELFDSVMSSSSKHGYSITNKTLYQLNQQKERKNILIVTDKLNLDSLSLMSMINMAKRDNKVMLVAYSDFTKVDSLMMRKLGAYLYGSKTFAFSALHYQIKSNYSSINDTVYWNSGNGYPKASYQFYKMFTGVNLKVKDDKWKTLCWTYPDQDGYLTAEETMNPKTRTPLAIKRQYGKGEIILASLPLLFTNYGILDNSTNSLVARLMSQIDDAPVVRRIDSEDAIATDSDHTFLRVVAKNKPLLYAWKLALILILLFFINNARRRQRVIPVIEKPKNHTLEFIKLIGTMMYNKRNRD